MIINPYSVQSAAAQNAFQLLTYLGQTTDLQFCLDAGEGDSYTSGQSWLDLTANDQDFFLGTTVGAQATDPTFNGVADTLSSAEFFGFDGGDFFTYDTTNEAWMQTLHKDNAAYSFAFWVYIASAASNQHLVETFYVIGTDTGIRVWISTTLQFSINVVNAGATVLDVETGIDAVATGAWTLVAISVDEALGAQGVKYFVNGVFLTSSTSTYVSPASGNATATLNIAGGASGAAAFASGNRMAMALGWSRAVTAAEIRNLWAATRGRFGV